MVKALGYRFWNYFKIDRAVFFAVAGRLWTSSTALVTTLLIATYFTRDLQGYHYTFNAVLGTLALVELGLATVVVSYASHEWSKLALDEQGRVTGDPDALSRLRSLGEFSIRWYLMASAVATAAMAIGGILFFGAAGDPPFQWKAPWIALCAVTGLNLCLVPIFALLEGCNQVSHVYALRLIQSVVGSFAAWLAIYLGAGLWVTSIVGAVGLLMVFVTVAPRYSKFLSAILLTQPQGPRIDWRKEILPMQWRIAVSWVSGYLMFWLFTPVLFHFHGPIVAGQMGMTWALVGALMSVASAWILPKAPRFGMLIAEKQYVELDRMFWQLSANVVVVVAAGALGIWALIFFLNYIDHSLALRLLPPSTAAYMLLATFISCASLPMSFYLRAHKREPLMVVSAVGGLLTGIAVVVLGKNYSADGVAIGYLAVTATVTPFVALIWQRRRAEWHAPTEP